jgi:hypothetical protein
MNCPKCNSSDTRKFSILYQSGTTLGDFTGGGIGGSSSGLGGGIFSGNSKNQTLLAQRVAPPKEDSNLPAVTWIAAIVGFIVTLPFGCGFGITAFAVVFIGLGLVLAIGNSGDSLSARRKRWENSWLCMKCGHGFVEGATSQPYDDELRSILQLEGKLSAIKRYRELTGVSLADAKEYVESL